MHSVSKGWSDNNNKQKCVESSWLFRPNRALGYVSNSVPASIRYVKRRKDTLITTCIGRSFQVYTASHFRLIHVSPTHPDEITALAMDRIHTYTASNSCIYAWRAGKHKRHVYSGHKKNVHLLLPFGSHLIAVDKTNTLRVWDIAKEEVYLEIEFDTAEFQITAIAHPPTYVNKILLGSEAGLLKIWNIKSNKLVYTFKLHSSCITCIEPSPALDIVAVGHQDGFIELLNLKYDEVLMEFNQEWGSVSRICFRSDGPSIMLSASHTGHMGFWNLDEHKIVGHLQAHEDSICTAICFANEPLLLTTSPDNSMKLWIFDIADGTARMLRIREGHTAPPLCIRYHGCSGTSILSSAEDSSLHVFSTISESLNKSMGKASYNRKASKKKNRFENDTLRMPPIVEFTNEVTREREWDNIAAIHNGIAQVTTWSYNKKRMGEHRLVPEKFQSKTSKGYKAEATCITLSHCGNFVIIGYSSGDVERFNIQSGIHRATYGSPAHESSVRGVACDLSNQFVITGCDDGYLKFWPFKHNVTTQKACLKMTDGITIMRLQRESAMLAASLVNFVINVVDTDTRVVVRKFNGHTAKINDITFSADSRWIISTAMDSTIKVWDIPSSYMIDHFKTERPCISLSMSPNGDFLATAHTNFLGIYLWANKSLFNQISLRSMDPFDNAPYVGLPVNTNDDKNWTGLQKDESSSGNNNDNLSGEELYTAYKSPAQLDKNLVTTSGMPVSRWQNLLDLEIIKKRNKPKTPPKTSKHTPFFLPTIAGLEMKFTFAAPIMDKDSSSHFYNSSINNLTTLGKLLEQTHSGNYENCVEYLKKLGPSMIDFEIKSLHPLNESSSKNVIQFLKMIEHMLKSNMNFELAQSYLSVFLRVFGTDLLDSKDTLKALENTIQVQQLTWSKIESKLMFGIGVVASLRNFV